MKFEDLKHALSDIAEAANQDAVLTLETDVPGPTVSVVALTHGNEVTGVVTAQRVLQALRTGELKQRSGKLQIVLANHEILREARDFDDLVRFKFEDMNRIWAKPGGGEHEYLAKERIRPSIEPGLHGHRHPDGL